MKHLLRDQNNKQRNYIPLTIFWLICLCNSIDAQTTMKASHGMQEIEVEKEAKPHYTLHLKDLNQNEFFTKCISKYAFWHKHRMLTRRRIIEVKAPYSATIELYSETELHQLYGKRILPGITDNESDYHKVTLEVTPDGFKEILDDIKSK